MSSMVLLLSVSAIGEPDLLYGRHHGAVNINACIMGLCCFIMCMSPKIALQHNSFCVFANVIAERLSVLDHKGGKGFPEWETPTASCVCPIMAY